MRFRTALLGAAAAALLSAAIAVQAQVPGVNSTLQSVFTLAYDQSTMKPTYSASIGAFTLPASASDVCTLTGSATKNVRIRRIVIGGLASTVQTEPIQFIKRSTADTGGAGNLMAVVPYDSINSLTGNANSGTAVAEFYTTVPTLGTMLGAVAEVYLTYGNLTTGTGSILNYEFGARGSPIVLRGIAQTLNVNLGATTVTSGQFSCTFEWTEE